MRKLPFILVGFIFVLGCHDESPTPKIQNHITIIPHNSFGEFYEGLTVYTMFAAPSNEIIKNITWDYGNQATLTTFGSPIYKQPGTYLIKVRVATNRSQYAQDTTITILPQPTTFSMTNERDRPRLIYKDGKGKLNMMYEGNTGSSVSTYYVIKLEHNLQPSSPPANLNFDWYPTIGPSVITSDGTLAITVSNGGPNTSLNLYSDAGKLIHNYYLLNSSIRDLSVADNRILMLCDSTKNVVIKTIDIAGNKMSSQTHYLDVAGMTGNNLFLTEKSMLVKSFLNSTNNVTLLMGADFDGNVTFSDYFQEAPFAYNITPISTGLLVNSALDNGNLKLTKINADHKVQWQSTILKTSLDTYSYYPAYMTFNIIVKEVDGFVYLFYDNMRCVKLTQDGTIIWNNYYYPGLSVLTDAEVDIDGSFVMVGTRSMSRASDYNYNVLDDVILIRIDKDGNRL